MIEVDVEELTTKNKLLLSQIQFLNDELCKAKKDLDAEKKKHEDDLEAARSDLVHMVEESVELKNQIQVLQEDLNDLEDQHINNVGNKAIRTENISLRKDVRTLVSQLEDVSCQYEMVRDEYNSTLFEANDLRMEVSTLKNELMVKSKELKRIYRELEQNRADIAMMMREYAEAKNEENLPDDVQEIQEDNHHLQNEIESLKRHNESLTVLLNELRMEIARISEQRTALPGLIRDLDQEIEADGETLESKGVVSSLLSPDDIHAALTLCINSLSVLANASSQSEMPEMVRCVSPILLVKKQLVMVNDETAMLIRREDQHREALMGQDAQIDELQQRVENMKRLNEALQGQVDNGSYENHALQQKLRERERELQTVRRDMMVLQGMTPAAVAPLPADNGVDTASLEDMERQLDQMRQQFTQRVQEDTELQEELQREKETLETNLHKKTVEVTELQRQVTTLTEDLEKQTRMVEVKDTNIAALKAEVEKVNQRLVELQEAKSQDVSSSTVAVTELKRLLAERDRQLREKQDALEDAEDALDDERDITAKLKRENSELKLSRDGLRNDVKDLEQDNEELLEQAKKVTELSKKLQAAETECQTLRDRVQVLTKEVTRLESRATSVAQTHSMSTTGSRSGKGSNEVISRVKAVMPEFKGEVKECMK